MAFWRQISWCPVCQHEKTLELGYIGFCICLGCGFDEWWETWQECAKNSALVGFLIQRKQIDHHARRSDLYLEAKKLFQPPEFEPMIDLIDYVAGMDLQ